MTRVHNLAGLTALALCISAMGQERPSPKGRPAPPPSRYTYSLKFNADSLPKGVKVREIKDAQGVRYFISNASETPLVINERFQNDTLASGSKLISGKVYQYFPNGVPMEGKTHLKGWQAPFGDIPETILTLAKEPARIHEGRKPGLSKELPEPEAFSIPAKSDVKLHEIRGTIHYHLNPAYDEFHKKEVEGK
jgi:hypothetical protein